MNTFLIWKKNILYFPNFKFFADDNGFWLLCNPCKGAISPLYHSLELYGWSQDPCSSWKTVLSLTDKPVPSEFSANAWKSTVAASFLGNSHARVMGTHHKMEQKTRQRHSFIDFLQSFGETSWWNHLACLFLRQRCVVHELWLAFYIWDDFYVQTIYDIVLSLSSQLIWISHS